VRRLFWLALGGTIGALLVRKLAKVAESASPKALAAAVSSSIGGLTGAIRDFADDVREGMAEREAELVDGVGLDGQLGARAEDF
jgi:hypothetical protein